MVDNKKNNAARKPQDFLQDIAESELVQSSNKDDEVFFEMLVDEVDVPSDVPPVAPPVEPKSEESPLKVVPNDPEVTRFEIEEQDLNALKKEAPKTETRREDKTTLVDDKTELVNEGNATQNLAQVSHLGNAQKSNPIIDLKNADYVRFAQEKILKLEKELMGLRQENQELAVAGDHFKTLSEDQRRKIKTLEADVDNLESTFKEEKKILMESITAKEMRVEALQSRVEDLEEQLKTKFNRLRMRERELESRLEIIKQENEAVAHSKDDMLVDLKKQVGSLTEDLEKARSQYQKSLDKLSERDEALRRTAKALKLSLTMLESQKNKD